MANEESTAAAEPLDVFTVLATMVEQMAHIGWQKLGLQPDYLTGKIHKDLVQAKVAIDTAADLAAIIEPQLDADDKRQIQGLIRDLRMNFVEKQKEEGA